MIENYLVKLRQTKTCFDKPHSPVTVRRHLGLAVGKLAAKDRTAALRALEEAES